MKNKPIHIRRSYQNNNKSKQIQVEQGNLSKPLFNENILLNEESILIERLLIDRLMNKIKLKENLSRNWKYRHQCPKSLSKSVLTVYS